jgi:ATP-dependent Clp protease ATP-binding subunit ClpC
LNMSIKNGDVLVAELDKENSKIKFSLKEKEIEKTEA